MNIRGNTILLTGGTSGIGLALANAFQVLGNRVIVAAPEPSSLKEAQEAFPQLETALLDLQSADSIEHAAQTLAKSHPQLNCLINNGGIQKSENLLDEPFDLSAMSAEIAVNLVGQIRLTMALLPTLRRQGRSTIVNVTSGLAFVPVAGVPTYCATKAAMHSYTLSLRHQLRETTTQVIELIPPQTQTNLRPGYAQDPRAMPLDDFIAEVMTILETENDIKEVVVERCKPIRFAGENGTFNQVFTDLNQRT